MRIDVHVHHHLEFATPLILGAINQLKDSLMTSQAELAQQLSDLTAQTEKARAEIVGKVASLEEAITNAGNVTPEVEAALASLKAAVQSVDDLNPDQAPAG